MAAADPEAAADLLPDLERDLAALQADWGRMEQQLLLGRAVRRARRDRIDPRRRRRHREPGLGRDAAAHVPALGGDAAVQDRDPRGDRGRRGRPEEVSVQHRRPLGVRPAAQRAGGASAGADQPIRLAEAAAHELRARRGDARGAGGRGGRDRREGPAGRYLSVQRGRRPARQQDRLRGADHPQLPTGIVVAVQSERSQHQNRDRAMAVLRAKLIERQMEEREAEMARLRGEHVEAGWGNQIRSYVLQPYTMVKDLRTGVETSNPTRGPRRRPRRVHRGVPALARRRGAIRPRRPSHRPVRGRRRGRCAPAGPRSATRNTAEPAKANQNGAVTPKRWASRPPEAEPTTRPPKTPTVFTLPTRPGAPSGPPAAGR